MRRRSPRWFLWPIIAVVIAYSVVIALCLLVTRSNTGFEARKLETSATVTEVKKGFVGFEFDIDHGNTTVDADESLGRHDLDDIEVGDRIHIFYDPTRPHRAVLSDFHVPPSDHPYRDMFRELLHPDRHVVLQTLRLVLLAGGLGHAFDLRAARRLAGTAEMRRG